MKRVVFFVALITACFTTHLSAEDGWDLTLGAGVYESNIYSGSDEYYVTPVPWVKASYTRGEISSSLSLLEGLGVMYINKDYGFLGSVTVNAGEERDSEEFSVVAIPTDRSDKTKKLLKDSPTVSTPIYTDFMLGYLTPIGIVGASIGYHPTTVEYDQKERKDEVYHGLLYSILYMIELPITQELSFAGMAGIEFMDQNYADAWYTIEYETEELDRFKAEAGLRDAQLALQFTYRFSDHIGVSLLGAETILLMDAERAHTL